MNIGKHEACFKSFPQYNLAVFLCNCVGGNERAALKPIVYYGNMVPWGLRRGLFLCPPPSAMLRDTFFYLVPCKHRQTRGVLQIFSSIQYCRVSLHSCRGQWKGPPQTFRISRQYSTVGSEEGSPTPPRDVERPSLPSSQSMTKIPVSEHERASSNIFVAFY